MLKHKVDPSAIASRLQFWLKTEEMADVYAEFRLDFLEVGSEEFDFPLDHFLDVTGEDLSGPIEAVIQEDFLSADFEGVPIIDAFLDYFENDWLSPEEEEFASDLGDAPFKLYRVLSVERGTGYVVEDVLQPVPIQVADSSFSEILEPGGALAARLVQVDGKVLRGEGALPFVPDMTDGLCELVAELEKECMKEIPKKAKRNPDAAAQVRYRLWAVFPQFAVTTWLLASMNAAMEGVELPPVFTYKILSSPELVNAKLAKDPECAPFEDEYRWYAPPAKPDPLEPPTAFVSVADDTLWLNPILADHADIVTAHFETLLGAMIGPRTEVEFDEVEA